MDESDASLVLTAFNLSDPHDEEHRASMLRRFSSFVERDANLRDLIARQLYDRTGLLTRDPFEIPVKHKLALVRIGLSLFQALFYRETREILSARDHVLVRYVTNYVDPKEGEWLKGLVSKLNTQTPLCADRRIEPRFVFGTGAMDSGALAIAAEIPGSTTWYGTIHRGAPPLELVEYFDWFAGNGTLIRSNDSTEPAASFLEGDAT